MNLFKIFQPNKREQELENKIKILEVKLLEKQEVINKTNAYWKKKLREISDSKNKL